MILRRSIVIVLNALLVVPALPAAGHAQRMAPAGPSLEEIAVMLASSEAAEVRKALEDAAVIGSPAAAAMVAERVKTGLPPGLLQVALDSLSLIGGAEGAEQLIKLTRHRRSEVRVKAIEGLSGARTPEAEAALLRALSDPAEDVRAAAASGLAEIGTPSAFAVLRRALERGVPTAARALGMVASAKQLAELAEFASQMSFAAVAPALDVSLARRDLPEAAKLDLVNRIAQAPSPDARSYLETARTTLAASASPRVMQAITQALAQVVP